MQCKLPTLVCLKVNFPIQNRNSELEKVRTHRHIQSSLDIMFIGLWEMSILMILKMYTKLMNFKNLKGLSILESDFTFEIQLCPQVTFY